MTEITFIKTRHNPVYIYGLFDPRNLELRYIGKTRRIKRRIYEHVLESKREKAKHTHKDNWILELMRDNLEPAIEILEECTEDNWQEAEQVWIAECKKFGVRLTNLTDGGENPPTWDKMNDPEAAKRKVGESNKRRNPPNKGRKWSQEYKDKMSTALSGKNNPMYGKIGKEHPATGRVVSSETRQRLSNALKGNKNPMYGKTHTEEARKKLSEASRNRKQTEIDKKKKSLAVSMSKSYKKGLFDKVKLLQKEYFDLFGCYYEKYLV